MHRWGALAGSVVMLASPALGPARADALDRLVAAYPQSLAGRSGDLVLFRNGVRLDAGIAGATDDARLRHASLRDQMRLAYPVGALAAAPITDPGRFRDKGFFDAMYGDCRKGQVEAHLVSLVWLPKSWGHRVEVTSVNGVAARLKEVSAELDALPAAVRRAAYPSAGTYACRAAADRGQPSMHAYGAAIDLNLAYADYWLWEKRRPYRNRMPLAVVAAFERRGFIWGGKWAHFDTMHFEYRPELLPEIVPASVPLARSRSPR